MRVALITTAALLDLSSVAGLPVSQHANVSSPLRELKSTCSSPSLPSCSRSDHCPNPANRPIIRRSPARATSRLLHRVQVRRRRRSGRNSDARGGRSVWVREPVVQEEGAAVFPRSVCQVDRLRSQAEYTVDGAVVSARAESALRTGAERISSEGSQEVRVQKRQSQSIPSYRTARSPVHEPCD